MTCFNVFIKILHTQSAKLRKFAVDMAGLVDGHQLVKLVRIGTTFLLALVGEIHTMNSVKNGFQARI